MHFNLAIPVLRIHIKGTLEENVTIVYKKFNVINNIV